jgi:diguanylate cyclase (GGDEF)-like protein
VALQAIEKKIGRGARVARFMGDEYLLIAPVVERAGARQIGRILHGEVRHIQLQDGNGTVRVSVSVGVALFDQDGKMLDALIKGAEHAKRWPKAKGKNRLCIFAAYKALDEKVRTALGPAVIAGKARVRRGESLSERDRSR